MSATTADDVAATIEEWLGAVHDVEADVTAMHRRSEGVVQVTVRAREPLLRPVLDGMRDKFFEVAGIQGGGAEYVTVTNFWTDAEEWGADR